MVPAPQEMRSPGGRPHQTDRVHLSPDLVSGPASSTPRRGARTVAAPVPPRAPVLSPPQTTARAATSLSSSVPQSLQTVVDLAARLTGCQYAAINLVSRHHQHSVVAAGGGPRELPRKDSLCATVLDEPGLVVVEDTRLDARMQDLRWVDPERGGTIGFYAIPDRILTGTAHRHPPARAGPGHEAALQRRNEAGAHERRFPTARRADHRHEARGPQTAEQRVDVGFAAEEEVIFV